MAMLFSDMAAALEEARVTQLRADHYAKEMAKYISGRLRSANIPDYILRNLKKELSHYNMLTGEWK